MVLRARLIDLHTSTVDRSVKNLSRWLTATVVSLVNSIPAEHDTRVGAKGRRHFRPFCQETSQIRPFTTYDLLSSP